MTIKAYGIVESLKTTTSQQTKRMDKGQEVMGSSVQTIEAFFAEFRIASQGKSAENFKLQSGLIGMLGSAGKSESATTNDLSQLQYQYNGRSILDFSQEEAQEITADDGYFGVANTAKRLADFVVNGAGDNLNRLKAGREGILKGFQDAEKIWGGTLPDISYKTLETALAKIDERIQELGGQVIDTTV